MVHAVVVMFDRVANAEVHAIWVALSISTIDSSMMMPGVAPHLTLAVMNDALPAPLISRVNALAAQTDPFMLYFHRIYMFEGNATVLYLAPQASTVLRRLPGSFHESAVGIGNDHTRRRSWVPHATIAMALRKKPWAAAHRILSNSFFAFYARVTALAVPFLPSGAFSGRY